MMIGFFSLLRKGNKNNPPVFFTSAPIDIAFFYQMIYSYCQGSYRNGEILCYCGHAPWIPDPHSLYYMHIIYRNILIFRSDQSPLLNVHNFIKQIYQNIIYRFNRIHSWLLSLYVFFIIPQTSPGTKHFFEASGFLCNFIVPPSTAVRRRDNHTISV